MHNENSHFGIRNGSLAICHIGVVTIKQFEPAQQAVQHGRSTVNLHRGRGWSEGVKPEIYRRMKVQYGDSCWSQGRMYDWVERFQNGRQNISDEHRSGRPVSVASETVKQQVELFFQRASASLRTGGPSVLRIRGTTSKNKTQTISVNTLVKKVIIKFLLFNDLPS